MVAAVDAPTYAFLAQPPPSKKRGAPGIPLPSLPVGSNENDRPPLRRRSATLTGINAWASQVQPGSPAPRTPRTPYTPTSPGRRSSVSRRSSLSRRRSSSRSITHRAAPAGSPSFLNLVDTPATGSYRTPEFDLTNLGYDTVFVSLPKTPLTPAHLACPTQMPPPPPSPAGKRMRFPTFGILRRGRGREAKVPASPTAEMHCKKASGKARPPPLNNDLLLAQFLDGGRLDQHATRAMARAADGGPVGAVHRDAQGVMWVDAAEPLEYAPLLGSPATSEGSWVAFTPYERRESVSSSGSSTADVGAVVRPAEV
ncbi:hypothetical protein HDZ31DRAFT_3437, partial [Schizophyllum fasciatum]